MASTVNLMDGVNLYAVASRSLEKAQEFKEKYFAQRHMALISISTR